MDNHFTNLQIDIDALPSIDTLNLRGLHKDYLTAAMLGNLLFWLVFLTFGGVIGFIKNDDLPRLARILVPIAAVVVMTLHFLAIYFSFKRKQYALRERDILYQSGLLWRQKTIIPFNRIQHAEVTQGPIQRMFGLSVLRIFTAGGSSSDMNIPGIILPEAHNIKNFILGKTAIDEEE